MEHRFLEELGLEKETVDRILDTAGRELMQQKESHQAQSRELAEAKAELERLRGMDADGLRRERDELSEQLERERSVLTARLQEERINRRVEQALLSAGAKSLIAARALMGEEPFVLQDGEIPGLAERVAAVCSQAPYLFEDGRAVNPPAPAAANGERRDADTDRWRREAGLEP